MLEATTFGGEKATSDVEAIDALLELARCMREQGFDIPDPDPVTGGFGELDKNSPEFTEAFEQCGTALGGK